MVVKYCFSLVLTTTGFIIDTKVVVTNGQRLIKFKNIPVSNRDFSVEYIFPDDGTHQILIRIDKGLSVRELAPFDIFVLQQGQ